MQPVAMHIISSITQMYTQFSIWPREGARERTKRMDTQPGVDSRWPEALSHSQYTKTKLPRKFFVLAACSWVLDATSEEGMGVWYM